MNADSHTCELKYAISKVIHISGSSTESDSAVPLVGGKSPYIIQSPRSNIIYGFAVYGLAVYDNVLFDSLTLIWVKPSYCSSPGACRS